MVRIFVRVRNASALQKKACLRVAMLYTFIGYMVFRYIKGGGHAHMSLAVLKGTDRVGYERSLPFVLGKVAGIHEHEREYLLVERDGS